MATISAGSATVFQTHNIFFFILGGFFSGLGGLLVAESSKEPSIKLTINEDDGCNCVTDAVLIDISGEPYMGLSVSIAILFFLVAATMVTMGVVTSCSLCKHAGKD